MTKLTGHFDGKVIVPDDPSKLKPDQIVTIEGEPADQKFGTVEYLLSQPFDPMPKEDAEEMLRAIEEGCERIEPERDVQF